MRLRNKPWVQGLIAEHPEWILNEPEPQSIQGQWQQRFTKDQPIELELGSGKGQFIIEKAQQNPERNFIAMELQPVAAAMILKKQLQAQLPNLQILVANGRQLPELFATGEISKLYLNFSDPWPKTRHEKRRLTAPNFLKLYQSILPAQGVVEFKTDNQGLFEYSLGSFNHYGMEFDKISLNLHQSPWAENNIMTEYEAKFSQKGQPIYYLVAHFQN